MGDQAEMSASTTPQTGINSQAGGLRQTATASASPSKTAAVQEPTVRSPNRMEVAAIPPITEGNAHSVKAFAPGVPLTRFHTCGRM